MEIGTIKVSLMDVDSIYYIYISVLITNTTTDTLMIDQPDSTKFVEPNSYFIAIIDKDTIPLNEYRPIHLFSYLFIPPQEFAYIALYKRDYEKYRFMDIDQLQEKLSSLEIRYNGSLKNVCLIPCKLKEDEHVKLLPNNTGIEWGFSIGYYEFIDKDDDFLLRNP